MATYRTTKNFVSFKAIVDWYSYEYAWYKNPIGPEGLAREAILKGDAVIGKPDMTQDEIDQEAAMLITKEGKYMIRVGYDR